jgi:membrane protease YdiL (CAAX protease family)
MKYSKTKSGKAVVYGCYLLLFFAVWTLYHFFVKDWLAASISPTWLCTLVQDGVLKNLIWTLPAYCLLCVFAEDAYVKPKQLFRLHAQCLPWLAVFVLFAVYLLLGAYRQNGSLHVQSDFGISAVITVLFVGLTEEMVFRGWLLNVTYTDKHQWLAIGCNAVLFLCIHFPKWLTDGSFVTNFTSFGFVCILALSVIFSLAFVKTKNLLLPMGLHMFWDLLMFLFY